MRRDEAYRSSSIQTGPMSRRYDIRPGLTCICLMRRSIRTYASLRCQGLGVWIDALRRAETRIGAGVCLSGNVQDLQNSSGGQDVCLMATCPWHGDCVQIAGMVGIQKIYRDIQVIYIDYI